VLKKQHFVLSGASGAGAGIYTDEDTSSAYVLTSEGLQTYKKITPGLVKK
jgi:hypothetical protein